MRRFNTVRIIRIAICVVLAFIMLAPLETEAARSRRKKASTVATTKSKTTSKRKKTSRKSTSGTPAMTVTQATREAAINASQNRSATSAQGGQKNKSETTQGGLKKISVNKPDLEEIRQTTLDPSNKMYFPKLMKKYLRNDTTMTPEEYRYLYLGYMFQEDYDPYRTSPFSEVTDNLRGKENLSRAERDTIRKYAELALKDNPFDLRQMSFLVHVLKENRKDMSAKIWEYRLENLLGAIKSTGTGEDEENAWFVIYPMHEYDMMQLLGYEAVDVDYIEPGFDKLTVEPDGTIKHRNPIKNFYFNMQVPQQQYELKHPEDVEEEAVEVEEIEEE